MNQEGNDDGDLRRYLLGELNEAEQQRLEERLLTERELFDLLPVIEDELVDDYLGGQLSSDERGRFESYFVSTPDRRRKLSFAMALRRYVTAEGETEAPATEAATATRSVVGRSSAVIRQAAWWSRALSSPYLRMATAALVMLGLGVGIWRAVFYQSEVDKGLAALTKAYPNERPTEARISGFRYAEYPKTRGTEQGRFDAVSRQLAEVTLLNEVATNPSPEAHHALGRVY
ncbi:MAG TPA: hypothetical protein VLM38_15065, partial [Blastocatellia bacterium]|nr:hypothetical protein [Blastocatellia bacterium]